MVEIGSPKLSPNYYRASELAMELFPVSTKTGEYPQFVLATSIIAGNLDLGTDNPSAKIDLQSDQVEDFAISTAFKEGLRFGRWLDSTGYMPDDIEVSRELARRING